MRIPKDHPRYGSLMMRERLVKGVKDGVTALEGLMAHGRGEAFDYLIGERTRPFAVKAMRAAVASLLLADHAVLSVNGNVVALCPKDMVKLSSATGAVLEVNIFYRTEARVKKMVRALRKAGARKVLGLDPDARIKGLRGARGRCSKEGIFRADVVFVPLEDGDRTEALVKSGRSVLTVDLNPLSRTAQKAQITIVDNVVRAVPYMTTLARNMKARTKRDLERIFEGYDNKKVLSASLDLMSERLGKLARK